MNKPEPTDRGRVEIMQPSPIIQELKEIRKLVELNGRAIIRIEDRLGWQHAHQLELNSATATPIKEAKLEPLTNAEKSRSFVAKAILKENGGRGLYIKDFMRGFEWSDATWIITLNKLVEHKILRKEIIKNKNVYFLNKNQEEK